MSEYYNIYRKRVGYLGHDPQQKAFHSGILEFRKNLKYSENTEKGLRTRAGKRFDGIILTDKQDENRISQILCTDIEDKLQIGDIITWKNAQWLIYEETVSSYQPYNKYFIVRCDWVIKWVDQEGELHQEWCYLVGQKDSRIKDNYRTWHNLITPQPNKYLEVIMPYHYIAKTTEVLIAEEAWTLTEYDKISVPNIIYMTFTEGKVNELRDNVELNIANYDKISKWQIDTITELGMQVGQTIMLSYIIKKDGIVQEAEATIMVSDNLRLNDDNTVTALAAGEGTITISYRDEIAIIAVTVGESVETQYFIEGNDKIRVTGAGEYRLSSPSTIMGTVSYQIDNTSFAMIESQEEERCIVRANQKNRIGSFTLSAYLDGTKVCEKEIEIIALW